MGYKTLCRNPKCLKPLHGALPVKLYCGKKCKSQASQYWRDLANNPLVNDQEQHAIAIEFEDKFVAEFEKQYNSPCFGIETEYGPD